MSATVGALLKELEPGWSIEVFERLQDVALESSHVLNNAGTGHAALCELNYTPERPDGSVDVSKALKINELFEVSRQFWAYLQRQGHFAAPREFITAVPHISFVRGDEDVAFLRKRCEALCGHPLFEGMQDSQDRGEMAEWMPLVMAGRDPAEPVAATRATHGTDVDFGALTRGLFRAMARAGGVRVHLQHEVRSLERLPDGGWRVTVKDLAAGESQRVRARFVFLGAGGRALPLLLGSGIPEARGYGGFPVSGMWLMCLNAEVIARHHAKVYGKAKVGAPPMSVPHLDTRSHRRPEGAAVRTLRRLLHEVPETGVVPGLAVLRAARQRRVSGHVRHPQRPAGPLPDRRGAAVVRGPPAGAARVLSRGQGRGLGAARRPGSASRSSARTQRPAPTCSSARRW